MKRLTFTIVLFLLIGFTYSCDENTTQKNDLTLMGFHGNIETIVQTEYNLSTKFGKEFIVGLGDKIINEFNNDGNMIEQNRYDSDGELESKRKYTHDENGNMIEMNWYDSDGELWVKWKCTYDENGNMIEERKYDSDGELMEKYTYTYDENGNIIEERKYEVYGVLEEPIMLIKYEFTYR